MGGALVGRRVRVASGHRTVADTHGGHAGPLAAAPTTVPDARPWLAATPRVVLTFTGRLSCWVRKPLYPSEANLSDPSTTFTERGAASPVRSDKGRSHFTGAECAKQPLSAMAQIQLIQLEKLSNRHQPPPGLRPPVHCGPGEPSGALSRPRGRPHGPWTGPTRQGGDRPTFPGGERG